MKYNTNKKYHYVYRITNILNNTFYVGSRSCNVLPNNDIGKIYFSSSTNKTFIQDQKNNIKNYKYKIIIIFSDRVSATIFESKYHQKFNVRNHPKFINKSNQTLTFFHIGCGKNHFTGNMTISEKKSFYKKHSTKISDTLKTYYKTNPHWSKQHKDKDRIYKNAGNKQKLTKTNPLINAKIRASIKEGCKNRDTSSSKNPNAKIINIYDNNNNLIYKCHGNFKQICNDNKMPYGSMRKTYINNTTLYETKAWQTRAKSLNFDKFIGWYARLI